MLDQDTGRALLEIVHATGAPVAFMADRHQLPAVGRGGVLDLAAQHACPDALVSLDVVHRFTNPEYAAVSLAMRRGEGFAEGEAVSTPCGGGSRFVSKPANRSASTRSQRKQPRRSWPAHESCTDGGQS